MEVVGIALATASTIDLCVKYGRILVDTCAAIKNATRDIQERLLRIENSWNRIKIQINFLNKVWADLDDEHQHLQDQILQVLLNKLTYAEFKIRGVIKDSGAGVNKSDEQHQQSKSKKVKALKYVFLKDYLDQALSDLVTWQREFDPLWFLTTTIASHLVDTELDKDRDQHRTVTIARDLKGALRNTPESKAKSVFRPEDDLKTTNVIDIPFSSSKLAQRWGSRKLIVLDTVYCRSQDDFHVLSKNIRSLARKLAHEDPIAFGLLHCKGAVKISHPITKQITAFKLIFGVPEGLSNMRSLRSNLLEENDHSRSDRLLIAKQLARSVSYVQTYGFVHKNIRPETIITLMEQSSNSSLGLPFLLGFNHFRQEDGQTFQSNDSAWEEDLYRHPQRQGSDRKEYYVMQHDIYSLGVCLMEIGLWRSFVKYDENNKTPMPSQYVMPVLGNPETVDPAKIKTHLLSLAQTKLPRQMGNKYASIVETCLCCLDEHGASFGDKSEFQDDDGIVVGVRYIEKVLRPTRSISRLFDSS
ncbi:MAG: hypothetical protein Q9160_003470 [Pyrenula sp. 1 TL-2023]